MAAVMQNIANRKKDESTDLIDQVFQHVIDQIERKKGKPIIVFIVPTRYNNTTLSDDQRKSLLKRIHKTISSSNSRLVSLKWEQRTYYDYRVISPCYSFDLDVYELISGLSTFKRFAIKINKDKTAYFDRSKGYVSSRVVNSMLS